MIDKKEKAAKRMLIAMAKKNIRQVELAEMTGIQKSSISHYSNGKRVPDLEAACKLANALGVDPEYLMVADDLDYTVVKKSKLQELIKNMSSVEIEMVTAYAQALTDAREEE